MAGTTDTYRFTITVTPMTDAELQTVVDFIRGRYGRKHLVHVVGRQPSSTPLSDAPHQPEVTP